METYEQIECNRMAVIIKIIALMYGIPHEKLRQAYEIVEEMDCKGAHDVLIEELAPKD